MTEPALSRLMEISPREGWPHEAICDEVLG